MNHRDPGASALTLPARVKGLDNESLYTAWTTHCLLLQCEPRELLSPRLLLRPIFGRLEHREADMGEIAKAMGISPADLRRLSGCDIGGVIGYPPKLLHPSLRYCTKCLAMGYHSIVFQHIAIARCPLHDAPLVDACPECAKPIEPTFGSVLMNAYECSACKAPLSSTVLGKADQQHARWADQMLGARRQVLALGVDVPHQGRRLTGLPAHLSSPANPAASRHYQRVSVWAMPRDPQWTSFREQLQPVGPVHTREVVFPGDSALVLAVRRVLSWLMRSCWAHEKAAMRLLGRLGRYPRGLSLNAHTSVISVALYKFAAAYDLLPEMRLLYEWREMHGEAERGWYSSKTVTRYGDGLSECPRLDARLLQLEMLGLFVKLLVRQRAGSFLDEVSWLDYPHPIEFAPSWRIEKGPTPIARVRYRATEVDVERLLKRTWNMALHFRNDDAVGGDGMWRHNHLDSLWHETMPSVPFIPGR